MSFCVAENQCRTRRAIRFPTSPFNPHTRARRRTGQHVSVLVSMSTYARRAAAVGTAAAGASLLGVKDRWVRAVYTHSTLPVMRRGTYGSIEHQQRDCLI